MNNQTKRPTACRLLSIFCFFIVAIPASLSAAEDTSKPNVVLIMTDNQGYFELGCKGNPYLETPNIDAFARSSVDFCNFHAENYCSPSRAALLTGRQPMRYGVHNTIGGVSILSPDETTLSDRLQSAGYRTGVFGKWHLGMSHPFHPANRGFDEVFVHGGGGIGQLEDYAGNNHVDAHFQHNGKWVKSSGFSTDVLFDQAMSFVESNKDSPFFCYIPTPATHFPVQAEAKALARIKQRGITSEQTNLSLLSMIETIDENVGRMLEHLDKLQLRENTLVIFMTDQGMRDRGAPKPVWPGSEREKELGGASEGRHRVFCMAQMPGLTTAGENHALTCIQDICPTILEVCGIDIPPGTDGRSLVPLLRGAGKWHDDRVIVMQCPRARDREKWKHAAIKMGPWRLVRGGRLYNIDADSHMENNLAAKHPAIVQKLNAAYEQFWNSLPAESDLALRHVLGADEAKSTLLCAMDWREGGAPWNSGALRDRYRGQGAWTVTVAQAGRYRFTLSRAMLETPMPLMADSAKVVLGPFSASTELSSTDTSCTIEINLQPGDYSLRSELAAKGEPKSWGANFVYVERLTN